MLRFYVSICWLHHLPPHQPFCFSLNRHCIFASSLFSSTRQFHPWACLFSMLYPPFFHPSVCYKRLSRAIHSHNRSHPAGTQFLCCITCLAISHFVSVWVYSCLSANSLVWHIYTFLSLNMPEHVFFLFHIHLPFSIPVCLMARLSRAIHQQIFSRLASTQFTDCMTCPTDTHFLLVCTDYHNFASLLIFLSLNMSVYASFPCLISLHPCVLPQAQQCNHGLLTKRICSTILTYREQP